MWLTKKLNRQTGKAVADGTVTENLTVLGEREYKDPESVLPYGFASVPAAGAQAVMIDGRIAGVRGKADLEEGEIKLASGSGAEIYLNTGGDIRLNSGGGAEILLRNTGEILINGQVFPPDPEG